MGIFVLLNWLGDCIGVVECLNAPSTGIHAAEVIPRIPTPNCIWRELVWMGLNHLWHM